MRVFIDEPRHKLVIKQADEMEHKALKNYLNLPTEKHRFDIRFKMGIWDGIDKQYDSNGEINLGLWKEVYKCCSELGYKLTIENKQDFPLNRTVSKEDFANWALEFFKDRKTKDGNNFFPRDYQLHSAFEILRNRYCNIEVATAGGKSLIFAMVAFYILQKVKPDAKFLLIVPSITLVTQFYNELVEYNWGKFNENKNPCVIELEEVMSETPRKPIPGKNPNIYIGTYQSLGKYPEKWFKMFYSVTVDECHGAKNATQQLILNSTLDSAYYRFGMTGTFPDPKYAEWLKIQAVTGPIVSQVKARFLMDKGHITPVKIKSVILNHNDTTFHENIMNVKKSDPKKAYELERVKVQTSESRLKFITMLAKQAQANTIILFGNIDHGKAIYDKCKEIEGKRVFYIDGTTSEKKRKAIKAEMENTDTIAILVASYGTLSTGVSINALSVAILADSFVSKSRVLQSIGRSLRLHKDKDVAIIIDIVDAFIEGIQNKDKPNILFGQYIKRKALYNEEKYPVSEKWVLLN